MRVSASLMSHHKREKQAVKLYNKLFDQGLNPKIIWDRENNEWETGKEALELHDNSDWHVVIQDDAIIGDNFYTNLASAIQFLPNKSLLSLYLGKTRPYPNRVNSAFNKAMASNSSFISAKTLLWGVCIAIPTIDIEPMLTHVRRYSNLQYDNRIGAYYRDKRRPVYYTTKSIVDHDDSMPSLTGHKVEGKRVAHNYSDDILEFNSCVIEM